MDIAKVYTWKATASTMNFARLLGIYNKPESVILEVDDRNRAYLEGCLTDGGGTAEAVLAHLNMAGEAGAKFMRVIPTEPEISIYESDLEFVVEPEPMPSILAHRISSEFNTHVMLGAELSSKSMIMLSANSLRVPVVIPGDNVSSYPFIYAQDAQHIYIPMYHKLYSALRISKQYSRPEGIHRKSQFQRGPYTFTTYEYDASDGYRITHVNLHPIHRFAREQESYFLVEAYYDTEGWHTLADPVEEAGDDE